MWLRDCAGNVFAAATFGVLVCLGIWLIVFLVCGFVAECVERGGGVVAVSWLRLILVVWLFV